MDILRHFLSFINIMEMNKIQILIFVQTDFEIRYFLYPLLNLAIVLWLQHQADVQREFIQSKDLYSLNQAHISIFKVFFIFTGKMIRICIKFRLPKLFSDKSTQIIVIHNFRSHDRDFQEGQVGYNEKYKQISVIYLSLQQKQSSQIPFANMNVLFFKQTAQVLNQETSIQSSGPFLIRRCLNTEIPQFKSSAQWSLKQKVKFAVFFNKNRQNFGNCNKRQSWVLFKNMAKFVKTRNYNQCKNYYTRIIRQFKTVDCWFQDLKGTDSHFQRYYQSYAEDIQVPYQSQRQPISIQQKPNTEQKPTDLTYAKPTPTSVAAPSNAPTIPHNILKIFYPDIRQQKSRQAQFRQCHELFLMWCAKVKELMQMSSEI